MRNHIPSGEKLDFLYRNLQPLLLTNMWHGKRIYVELRLKMSCLHPNFLRHYCEYGPKKQFLSIISSLQWQVFTPCVCTFNYTRLGLAIGIYKQISKHRIHMKTDEFYFRTKDGKNSDQINFHSQNKVSARCNQVKQQKTSDLLVVNLLVAKQCLCLQLGAISIKTFKFQQTLWRLWCEMICLRKLMETLQHRRELRTQFGFVPKKEADQKETVLLKILEFSFSCKK